MQEIQDHADQVLLVIADVEILATRIFNALCETLTALEYSGASCVSLETLQEDTISLGTDMGKITALLESAREQRTLLFAEEADEPGIRQTLETLCRDAEALTKEVLALGEKYSLID